LPSPAAAVIAIAIVNVNAGGRECESTKNNEGGSERLRGATLVDEGHAVVNGVGGRALHPLSWLSLRPPSSTSAIVAAVAAVNIGHCHGHCHR